MVQQIGSCIIFLFLLLPSLAYARGERETVTQVADGIDIWQTEFDVSGMEPGLYNFIVNSKDAAGNVGTSGPFNVRVDRYAGLPEVNIVYPLPNQVIRGDVDIVGVVQAPYGIKSITIKIDGVEHETLEGQEFWRTRIDASDLSEGLHVIQVTATDTNDLTGQEYSRAFNLDIEPPYFELIDREIGDIIAGTVRIQGRVTDANGIESLSLSRDGGVQYKRLALTKKKGYRASRYFQFTIPTRKYEDGPLVYFLSATNSNGITEVRPVLFFVNNDPPKINIISPRQNEDTFGLTQVTGRVISGVGLTEFYYEWAGERQDIPLRPGDPFWSVVFPISMANNRAIPFTVTAVDKGGNRTTVTQRFQDTRKYRTPTIIIEYPAQPTGLGRMQLAYDQPIYGRIADGFFPYGIIVENEIEYVMAQPSFRIDPRMIPVGSQTMRMWAIDEDGVTGEAVNLRVERQAPPEGWSPVESDVVFDTPEFWNEMGDYRTPWFGNAAVFQGQVENYRSGTQLEYRMNWRDNCRSVPLDARGGFDLTVSLLDQAEGAIPIEFRTIRNGTPDYPLYAPVNKSVTLPTMTFLTPHPNFGPVARATTVSGMIDYVVPLEEVSYSVDGEEFIPVEFAAKFGRAWFAEYLDFADMNANGQTLVVRVVDRAGNIVEASPDFEFDNSASLPIVILNTPRDGDMVTSSFDINGLAYADSSIAAVHYRILSPENPWDSEDVMRAGELPPFQRIETAQNFQVNMSIDDVREGDNILEIFAEDFYGEFGETTKRVFRANTSLPEVSFVDPAQDAWSANTITVRGTAFDLTGIADIQISMDNGTSWQRANFSSRSAGSTPWSISLNTNAYADGIYNMLVRAIDLHGRESFTAGIINIDNHSPTLEVGLPRDGSRVDAKLSVSGQIYDALGIGEVSAQLVSIDNPATRKTFELPSNHVFIEDLDISGFPNGDYILKISAFDLARSETVVIRNISIVKGDSASEVVIINPMSGIDHSGPLIVSGRVTGAVIPDRINIMMDGKAVAAARVSRYGIFRYEFVDTSTWTANRYTFSANFRTPGGNTIVSFDQPVNMNPYGPVVEVDSHLDGDIITERPWLTGRAYMLVPPDEEAAMTKSQKRVFSQVNRVELSFDNGRTFSPAMGTSTWRFRLETSELPPGLLPILIRAVFENGNVAMRRIVLTSDSRPPDVVTVGPSENTAFRDSILVYGSTSDQFEMDSVEVSLRPGDKIGYSVPSFIQGLYIDTSILGGFIWATGIGLTFFDDNVKVQANAGLTAPGRFFGWSLGGKVLANVYRVKLSQFMGLDWDFWETSFALGAQFTCFSMAENEPAVWIGQFLGQWEIVKADMSHFFPEWKYFKSASLYLEPGIWFAPSDVTADINAWRTLVTLGFGARLSLF